MKGSDRVTHTGALIDRELTENAFGIALPLSHLLPPSFRLALESFRLEKRRRALLPWHASTRS